MRIQKREFLVFVILLSTLIIIPLIPSPTPPSSFSVQPVNQTLILKKHQGLEKYLLKDKSWSIANNNLYINLTINTTVYNWMHDTYTNWGTYTNQQKLQKCNKIKPYIQEDYPNFDCLNSNHQTLLLNKVKNFVTKGFKLVKKGVNQGYINITGNKINIEIPISTLKNKDIIEIGESSLIYEYQEITTVQYIYHDFEINSTLEEGYDNRTGYATNYPEVWITEPNLKFGAERVNTTKNLEFRYIFESTKEILKDREGYYLKGRTTFSGTPQKRIEEKVRIDVSDICNIIYNESNSSIIDFDPNCEFNEYSIVIGTKNETDSEGNLIQVNVSHYYLEVYFTGRSNGSTIFIDPSYSITEFSTSESIYTNITQENNFTHLTLNAKQTGYGLVFYNSFDINHTITDNKTYDYTDNDNDGDVYNATWNPSCLYGGCYDFDGVNDWIEIKNNASIDLDTFSISFWIKTNTTSQYVMSKKNSTLLGNGWHFSVVASERMYFEARDDNGGTFDKIQVWSTTSISDNKWHHVLVVKNNTNASIYINSVIEDSDTNSTLDSIQVNDNLFIGLYYNGYFNGSIDEIMIWNYTLNATQIQDIYNNQSVRFKVNGTQEFKQFNMTLDYNWLEVTEDDQQNMGSDLLKRLGFWNVSKGYKDWSFEANTYGVFDGNDYINVSLSSLETTQTWWAKNSTENSWHFYANSSGTEYVDGVAGTINEIILDNSTGNLRIGNNYNGSIDEVRIYNRSLTAAEILEINNSGRVVNSSLTSNGLVLYFDFEEDSYLGDNELVLGRNGTSNNGIKYGDFEYEGENLNNSLVLYMHFDNLSSYGENDTYVYDFSKNNNNGTVNGSAVWTSDGYYSGAFKFDGLDDYIDVGNDSILNITNDFTISLWFYYSDEVCSSDKDTLIAKDDVDTGRSWTLYCRNSTRVIPNSVAFEMFDNNSYDGPVNSTADALVLNSWNHVLVTFNSTYTGKIYVNGVSKGEKDNKVPLNSVSTNITIGARISPNSSKSVFLNGSIDEVMIFNRTLNNDEIKELYIKGRAKFKYTDYQDADSTYFTFDYNSTNFQLQYLFNAGNSTNPFYSPVLATSSSEPVNFTTDSTTLGGCSNLGTANTEYTLGQDISDNNITHDCIIIAADNITLDCSGYYIKSIQNYSGVYSDSFNTTIKNCNITMGSDGNLNSMGIELLDNADNSSLINNTLVGEMRYGIKFKGSNSLLRDNYADVSALFSIGIFLNDNSHNTLINNMGVSLTEYGIYLYLSSNNILTNNTGVSTRDIGIILHRAYHNTLTNSTGTSNSSSGIYLLLSDNNTLTNSTGTSNSSSGIYLFSSKGNVLITNTFIGYLTNSYGVALTASKNNLFQDCINISGVDEDIFVYSDIGSTNNTFLNCSYNISKESVNGASNELIRKWYYRAYVNDTKGNIIENVNVTAVNVSGDYQFSRLTNSSGYIPRINIIDYINIGGTRIYYSNYTINATNITDTTTKTYNVTSNQNNLEHTFKLGPDDITPPSITIISPEEKTYTISQLDFNVSTNENTSSCWFSINSNENVTMSKFNITYFNYTNSSITDGSYSVEFFCNDTSSNLANKIRNFAIDTTGLSISLEFPLSNNYIGYKNNIYFNYTPTSDTLDSCILYGNWTGSWHANQTNSSPINASTNSFIVNLTDGTYKWNIWCNESAGTSDWSAQGNLTFTIDTIYPEINITNIDTTVGFQTVTFNYNITEDNLHICFYEIKNSTGGIDGLNNNISINCTGVSHTATVTNYSTYTYILYARDKAGNENSSNQSFTTTRGVSKDSGGSSLPETLTITETVNLIDTIALIKSKDDDKVYTDLDRAKIYKVVFEFYKERTGLLSLVYPSEKEIKELQEELKNVYKVDLSSDKIFSLVDPTERMKLWIRQFNRQEIENVKIDERDVIKWGLITAKLEIVLPEFQISPATLDPFFTFILFRDEFKYPVRSNKVLSSASVIKGDLGISVEITGETTADVKLKVLEKDFIFRTYTATINYIDLDGNSVFQEVNLRVVNLLSRVFNIPLFVYVIGLIIFGLFVYVNWETVIKWKNKYFY